jgi:hypothetical protein
MNNRPTCAASMLALKDAMETELATELVKDSMALARKPVQVSAGRMKVYKGRLSRLTKAKSEAEQANARAGSERAERKAKRKAERKAERKRRKQARR